MNMKEFERILVLAPHTDDGELGLGATMASLVQQGNEVFCYAFSNASKTLPKRFPPNTLEIEFRKAMKILGLEDDNVFISDYEVRTFTYHRQKILDELIKIRNDINPELVFLPSTHDIHQDHQVICNEGIRAFKTRCILGYEMPWNNISFPTNCFFVVEEEHIQKKIDALLCYESQKYRSYINPEFIRALAITRGTQIQVKFAEAFESIRWVWS
jgi:LmbE family N-acetylglucosaminyl deacetylase